MCPQHGADPTKKNRDGNTALDLVKDSDTDIQDLLRGDAALLDAAKKGCLARVKKLCRPDNVNCRDTQGRHSTPLHLAGERARAPSPWRSCPEVVLVFHKHLDDVVYAKS